MIILETTEPHTLHSLYPAKRSVIFNPGPMSFFDVTKDIVGQPIDVKTRLSLQEFPKFVADLLQYFWMRICSGKIETYIILLLNHSTKVNQLGIPSHHANLPAPK